jgi:hypothetical protein
MPAGIQSRISQHGDPDELDLIQNAAGNVSASPAPSRLATSINVIF